MPQLVVHFEVIGKDPERLRQYFSDLFGWKFDTPSPVAQEVSAPDSYGFLDLVTSEDGAGIRGCVGGGPNYESHAAFCDGVPNVEAALQRAERLGGTRVMDPAFAEQRGNRDVVGRRQTAIASCSAGRTPSVFVGCGTSGVWA